MAWMKGQGVWKIRHWDSSVSFLGCNDGFWWESVSWALGLCGTHPCLSSQSCQGEQGCEAAALGGEVSGWPDAACGVRQTLRGLQG